jgi:hypothetical protein
MMEKILLFQKEPTPAYQWQKEDPFALRESIGADIRPRVNNSETSYCIHINGKEEWLQDGAFIVEVLRGMFVVLTPEELDRRFVR